MPIVLAEIEFNRIQNLRVDENRAIVEHKIPGSDGNVFQDLGRGPVTIDFDGFFQGDSGLEKLRRLRQKFNDGEVLPFSSDAATPPDIDKVIIDSLRINELAGRPELFRFSIVLKEVAERAAGLADAPEALVEINAEILDEANLFLANAEDGLNALLNTPEVLSVVDLLIPQVRRLGELIKDIPEF